MLIQSILWVFREMMILLNLVLELVLWVEVFLGMEVDQDNTHLEADQDSIHQEVVHDNIHLEVVQDNIHQEVDQDSIHQEAAVVQDSIHQEVAVVQDKGLITITTTTVPKNQLNRQ